jgi:hypothetical protein
MPLKRSGLYKRIILISSFTVIVAFAYQNCSSEIDNTMVSNVPAAKTLDASSAKEVPFAFDTSINEIAYMSCSHIDTNFNSDHMSKSNTYFSFKVGAYNSNSGVGLRDEFRNYLTSNFANSTEVVPDSIIQSAFKISPQNNSPNILFSNRPMSNPVSVVYKSSNNTDKPAVTIEFDLMLSLNTAFSSLTYGDNLKQVSALMNMPRSTRINYFNQLGTNHNLFAGLNYHYSPDYTITTAEALRSRFSDGQNSNFLTLTYTQDLKDPKNQTDPYISRRTYKDTDNGTSVWGRGYKPSFRQDPRVSGLGYNNVLSSVDEYDLSEGLKPIVATWICDTRYLIISPIDNDSQTSAFPNPYGDPIPSFSRCSDPSDLELTASQKIERQLIQRYLPSANWIINPIHKCLVPRAGSGDCYQKRQVDPDGHFIPIKYVKTVATDTCGAGTAFACPEFLSLCIRN